MLCLLRIRLCAKFRLIMPCHYLYYALALQDNIALEENITLLFYGKRGKRETKCGITLIRYISLPSLFTFALITLALELMFASMWLLFWDHKSKQSHFLILQDPSLSHNCKVVSFHYTSTSQPAPRHN